MREKAGGAGEPGGGTTTPGRSLARSSAAEYLTFVAATGKGGVEAIYADENVWLTQKMMGVLYDVETQTINYHLKKVFADTELAEQAVIRSFRITAADGKRYDTKHYNLSAVIAVGYKVNSERAVQFRKWASAIVESFTIKGFAMDDERLKSEGTVLTRKYFEEQLQRIREIRLSERKFYQKITDLYATAIDYDSQAQATQRFFATVQNKLHWANPRADGRRGHRQPGGRYQGTHGAHFVEGRATGQDPEVRRGRGQELPDRRRNGATAALGVRLPGSRRRHGPATDPDDHAGLGNEAESLHRCHRPGGAPGRGPGHGRNRARSCGERVRKVPHRAGSPFPVGLRSVDRQRWRCRRSNAAGRSTTREQVEEDRRRCCLTGGDKTRWARSHASRDAP